MDRGLLMDFGGVLTSSVLESFGAFCRTEGIDVDVFREVVTTAAREPDSPFARIEVGAIEPDEFDAVVARLIGDACGRRIEPAGLKARLFAATRPDALMRAVVRAARDAGVRTALVSNSWGGHDYPLDELSPLFDEMVISGHVGMRKPDPEIYLHAAERVRLEPGACVFVDDFRVNVEGAEAVGMKGILHRDPEHTIPALEGALGIPLQPQ